MAKLTKRLVRSHFESRQDGLFEGSITCAFEGVAENDMTVLAYLFADFLRRLKGESPELTTKPDKAA